MKKTFKILLSLLFVLFLFNFTNIVKANSIDKISMDIYIDKSGNATVTEVWNCSVREGTEVYHPYYNLGNSRIQNLSVKDVCSKTGTNTYTTLSKWDTSSNFTNKSYKCGINYISNGVELCWGISAYGTHSYTVTYTITNFVSELTDSQMIYWTLIPHDFSSEIKDAYIKIHTDFDIPQTVDVWGYGNYGGTTYVYDGYIEMQPDSNLDSDEYMTILVKFPLGTFTCSNKLNNDFNHYYTMAQDGAKVYKEDSDWSVFGFLTYIPTLLFFFVTIFIAKNFSKYKFDCKKKLEKSEINYYRDIPNDGDILRSYSIAYIFGLIKNSTDILGAIFLKWLKDDIIKIQKDETGTLFNKDKHVVILDNDKKDLLPTDLEKELFDMIYVASKDGILETKEFERWCKNHYSKILSWFDDILKEEELILEAKGLLYKENQKTFLFNKYHVTNELREEALKIAGLKKYLKEYTLIKDREAIEVHLFEDYLIFAQMMGIAKEVSKEFKDLYPEIIEESNFNSYDNIRFINMCSTYGIMSANTARSRAQSYTSGGGGFSSGGGGGGSFGGGGGGGGFR